jgi:hypothetical protein
MHDADFFVEPRYLGAGLGDFGAHLGELIGRSLRG